ncbi:uncharacterized protein LOC131945203 [Physella acuta]|uniref:uncharacterized protein LOC131945203 n=1 Tax=Physella acuta TaxID=109671 RepID=UPI0027DAE9FE|nr:uncharacterized protein LOC131945203 [Physella acuta]
MIAVLTRVYHLNTGISFDPDSYSNVDERSLCVYTLPKVREQLAQLTGKRVHIWDLNHPVIPYPRSNAAVVVLGETICVLGGFNQSKRSVCTVVHYYDTHRKRWRVGFGLPEGHYSSLDGVVLTVPDTNKSFCFNDRNLYKNWILW